MAKAMTSNVDWAQAWYTNKEAVYLNAAGQAPMPRVSLEAVQAALNGRSSPTL